MKTDNSKTTVQNVVDHITLLTSMCIETAQWTLNILTVEQVTAHMDIFLCKRTEGVAADDCNIT